MYDKLIERLRECAAEVNCTGCDCNNSLIKQAADAIERLDAIAQTYVETVHEIEDKRKWIPVTERLPEEYNDVLCYYEYFRYGDYNCMFRTIDRGYYGDGRWGGEAGQGHKNKVLAWMPLPQPPTEMEP